MFDLLDFIELLAILMFVRFNLSKELAAKKVTHWTTLKLTCGWTHHQVIWKRPQVYTCSPYKVSSLKKMAHINQCTRRKCLISIDCKLKCVCVCNVQSSIFLPLNHTPYMIQFTSPSPTADSPFFLMSTCFTIAFCTVLQTHSQQYSIWQCFNWIVNDNIPFGKHCM